MIPFKSIFMKIETGYIYHVKDSFFDLINDTNPYSVVVLLITSSRYEYANGVNIEYESGIF